MCGRFALFATVADLVAAFGLDAAPDGYRPSWNIAPGRDLFAVVPDPDDPGRVAARLLRFGFPPAPGAPRARPLINARLETADRLPTFRAAYARSRCLVPANGFYEWKREGPARLPYFIRPASGELFAIAALRSPDGGCALLTAPAAAPIIGVHDRMPHAVPRDRWRDWLRGADDADSGAADAIEWTLRPVAPLVNRAADDGPELLDPGCEQGLFDLAGGDA